MRLILLAALACSPLLLLAAQDPQDEAPNPRRTFLAFQEGESARIDKDLQGAWMLMEYHHPDQVIDPESIRGFFMFHDGYMMLSLQGGQVGPGFLGTRREYTVQSGAYRYQIVEGTYLQTAGMIGFTNANPEGRIDFRTVLEPQEYRITVTETDLTLVRSDHRTFVFRRLQKSAFPAASMERLTRLRGGAFLEDDDGLGGGDR